ncbi:MAG: hypothetical protein JNN05_07235 [Candidatus Omnitrophica bacterium]|nr:hypothetical protein [Candidatus Omnitrophota bacterium]
MSKGFESEIIIKTFLNVAQQAFSSTGGRLVPSDDPTHKTQNIIEYQGRMSASGMDKFNAPTYVAGVSFYLSEQDREKHRAKGAMVLYLEALNADKFFKAFGHPVTDEDDEEEAGAACGKICTMLAEKFKSALSDSAGASQMVLSQPVGNKNSLPEGVDFSADQKQKQEISFYFWKKKSMVVDITLVR